MNPIATLVPPVSARDHAEGPESAPLTLVEYGDYQCPFCSAAFPVVKRIQKRLGRDLRFVFRNFPLRHIHPFAELAAETAEAAGLLGKFWPMHDVLFKNQASLTPESLVLWARRLGLEDKELAATFGRPEIASRIKEDRMSGLRSGVNGTPTFYINGARYEGMPVDDELLDALDAALRAHAAR
ncbi:MAG TPA: DsbA family protein [Elusimicrobiota bacterium]|nr:DsbA family protein [Elusimicrobiota bacterium]